MYKMSQPRLPFVSTDFRGYPNVKFLAPDKLCLLSGKRFLYKYLNEESFKATLENGFRFVEPSTWEDRFERRFYSANYDSINPAFPQKLFAACFTSRKNNEAAWKTYLYNPQSKDPDLSKALCFRLTINRKLLKDALKQFSQYTFYEGPIVYLNGYTISQMHKPNMPGAKSLYNAFFGKPNFGFDDFLSLLLIKRDFFQYEEEVRYFAVPREDECLGPIYVMPLEGVMSIVEKVFVARPYGKFKLSDTELNQLAENLKIDRAKLESFDLYSEDEEQITINKISHEL